MRMILMCYSTGALDATFSYVESVSPDTTCGASWTIPQTWPNTSRGLYGSSRYLISSGVNSTLIAPAFTESHQHVPIDCPANGGHMTGNQNAPMMSSRFFRLVVPTIGAVTPAQTRGRVLSAKCLPTSRPSDDSPSFAMLHATAIWAMLTLFFFASSSTLRGRPSARWLAHLISAYVPVDDFTGACPLLEWLGPTIGCCMSERG